jgi:DNA-binding Lrp family transcriptional regulator
LPLYDSLVAKSYEKIHVLQAVATVEHTDANRDSFASHVQSLPEVTECYPVSGGYGKRTTGYSLYARRR